MKLNSAEVLNANRVKHALKARYEINRIRGKEEIATAYENALTMFSLFLEGKNENLQDWDYLGCPSDAGVEIP